MNTSTLYAPGALTFASRRTYLLALAFIAGNVVLPQICHLVPQGGMILLPIYFFTLIGAFAFGWRVGDPHRHSVTSHQLRLVRDAGSRRPSGHTHQIGASCSSGRICLDTHSPSRTVYGSSCGSVLPAVRFSCRVGLHLKLSRRCRRLPPRTSRNSDSDFRRMACNQLPDAPSQGLITILSYQITTICRYFCF